MKEINEAIESVSQFRRMMSDFECTCESRAMRRARERQEKNEEKRERKLRALEALKQKGVSDE